MARAPHFYGLSEQRKAGRHRLDDARILIRSARWRGGMYLAGDAVECALKTKLMGMFGCRNLSELEKELKDRGRRPAEETVFTHQLNALLVLTQALDRLRQDSRLWRKFALVNTWVPA